MKKKILITCATASQIFFLFQGLSLRAQISGKVLDSEGIPIVSASVVIQNQSNTLTDFDGKFTLPTPNSFPVILGVYQSGYVAKELELFAENQELVIYLQEGQNLDEVIVTAGRRLERIQDATNSVSVIYAREIASKPLHNPTLYLENLAGIDVHRQSGSRVNVNLRGPAGVLTSDAYVMLDYRGIVQTGLNVFDQNATTLNALDLERVEVVRGPISSLYGPGVSSGVVHFLSKDPFKYPGTEIELTGGNLDTYRTQIRSAGTNAKKNFGYKINIGYQQNGEWDVPIQKGLVNSDEEFEIDEYNPYNTSIRADGSLYFKLNNNFNITTVGGIANMKVNFWTDRGPVYQDANDIFFQARAQNDNFFVQLVYNSNINNPDEKGFLYYTGGEAVIDRTQTEIQIQYNNQLSFINTEYTLGVERRSGKFDSPAIFGRNDVNDDLTITGAYLQTKSEILPQLDLVLSGRFDHYEYSSEVSFSPNTALVFNPNPKHTFRASFSQTYITPSAIELYTDFVFIPEERLDLWLYGGKNPINIPRDPEIQFLEPLIPNQTGLGVNYATVVGIFHQQFGIPNASLGGLTPWQAVDAGVNRFAQSLGINPSLLPSFSGHMQSQELLTKLALAGDITTGATIGVNGQPLEPKSTKEAKLRSEVNFEIGWKGIIGDKVQLSLDVFNLTGSDFTLIRQVTPLVAFPSLKTDVRNSIKNGGGLNTVIQAHMLQYVQNIYGALRVPSTGLPAGVVGPNPIPSVDQVVQLLWTTAVQPLYNGAIEGLEQLVYGPNGDQNQAGVLAVVRSDKNPNREKPVVIYSYSDSNIEKVSYTGIDFGSRITFSQDISAYANYSWVSQNIWRGQELGPEATESDFFGLNKPIHRLRLGFNYNPTNGFNFGMGSLYSSKFESLLSPLYDGEVDSRFIVNANVGLSLKDFSISMNIDNLFNTEYSLYPRMPKVGTRVLATVRYRF